MGHIANAIRARGERLTIVGRITPALISRENLEFDADRGRVINPVWHLRVALEDTPCDSQGNTLLKSGDLIVRKNKRMRIISVTQNDEDVQLRAREDGNASRAA